ncbi:hypothetical protein A3Q34_06140 [Colwellia sp. PAMC 20917]|nr:hypothetical protein A3Q34_06140 [Colwellia sp. PAMC 20917]
MSVYCKDNPKYFSLALKSLLHQSEYYQQLVLVCDGKVGSELEAIIKEYKEYFTKNKIDFINPKTEVNNGLGKALNIGTAYCNQDYIVRMDSDDICADNRFQRLVEIITDDPETDVIGTQIEEFNKQPGDLKNRRVVPTQLSEIINYSKMRNPMNHVTVCIKRKSLLAVEGYENVLFHEDYYLWLKMISKGMNLKNVNEVHVFVRVGDLGNRRNGIKYFKNEIKFLKAAIYLKEFTIIDSLKYILPRILVRLLPGYMVSKVYKKLRVSS